MQKTVRRYLLPVLRNFWQKLIAKKKLTLAVQVPHFWFDFFGEQNFKFQPSTGRPL